MSKPKYAILDRKTIFDLPIENQQECAKIQGYTDFEKWKIDTRRKLEEDEARPLTRNLLTRKEAEKLITELCAEPGRIHFIRRMTELYDLTIEDVIENIKSRIVD